MTDPQRSAEQLCDEAQARQRAGQIDDARILYERAVAADPDHYRAAFLLGHLHAAGERVDDAAVCARNAYRIYPCASSREFVIDATARRAFFNASRGATAAVVADFDFLLSIAANEPAAALYEFLKDQYRDDPDVAAGVASSLTRQHRRDLLADWGEVAPRRLLILPPTPLTGEQLGRFLASLQHNLGAGETELATRGPDAAPDLKTYRIREYSHDIDCCYATLIFIDAPGDTADSEAAARTHDDVYRFDRADQGFEIRLMPVGRERGRSDYRFIDAHAFNWNTASLHNHYYFFPYGYLYRYTGLGPINAFGHRITQPLDSFRNRRAEHKLIACFGGSSCFSMYCLPDETFAGRLEARLNERAKGAGSKVRWSVLNFGQHGNVVLNEILTYLLFAAALKPDIVIAHDGFNDLGYGQIADRALMTEQAICYQTNLEAWSAVLHGAPPPDTAEVRERNGVREVQCLPNTVVSAYISRKRQFQAMADAAGARFIWGLQPFLLSKRRRSPDEKEFERKALHEPHHFLDCYRNMSHLYEATANAIAGLADVESIDFHAAFAAADPATTDFFDFVHLSPAGDDRIAAIYAERIDA